MYRSKLNSEGQIVIPEALRDRLGWREGDEVVFYRDNGKLTLQALPKRSLDEVAAQLPGLEVKVAYSSFEELLELEKQSARERRAASRADR